jgi:predicted RNA-binding protein with RPS1 domain
MVFGLLRLDRKVSAAKKRLSRLRSKPFFTGYVSQIRPSNDQFEIILSLDDLPKAQKMVSCGSLKVGQEVVGRVERVEPYGVLVTVEVDGATVNRHGLLHIQKVADLFGQFINKEEGLKKAGLGRGERVKLQVTALASKRLSLDFTEDVKANARQEQEDIAKQRELKRNPPLADASRTVSGPGSVDVEEGADELEANDDEVDWEEEGDEGYDEDRDIEDQLGLGSY